MATKVFISWSGDLSNKLAEAIRVWLPGVLQFVRPYFTPSDIEKGTKWASEIATELTMSDIGIICLTKDNPTKPWLLFESGALSKNLDKAHVCTLLFNVEPADLTGPLTLFQNTRFTKNDFKKLVATINHCGGELKLEDAVFHEVFDMWWPKLEDKVNGILESQQTVGKARQRSERDILEELLELARMSAKGDRGESAKVRPEAVRNLVEGICGTLERAKAGCALGDIIQSFKSISPALHHLCRATGTMTLFDFYNDTLRADRVPLAQRASGDDPCPHRIS